LVRQQPAAAQRVVLASLRHPQQQQSDTDFLLNTLGRLWLAGVEIDWFSFHEGERLRRVPLPTYPFERERYWIEPRKQAGATGPGQQALTKKSGVAEWFYTHSWKRSAPPEVLTDKKSAGDNSRWLVFAGEGDLGAQLVKQLEQTGHHVVTVVAGDQFARLRDQTYTINPRRRGDYNLLLEALRSAHESPQLIAHLWTVARNDDSPVSADSFEESQYSGFFSLIFLAQALGEQRTDDSVRVVSVSSGLHEVTGEEALRPERATVLGPCKVIAQEYPNITCRSIDIVTPQSGSASEQRLVSWLIREIAQDVPDRLVAYRGNHRWTQVFEPVRLNDSPATRLRERGVYVITGLDDFSLALAEHLAQEVHGRLLLIAPLNFPERNDWQTWIESHDDQDALSQTLRKIVAIEKSGAEVVVARADLTDREEMERAINETRKDFGQINGVIHSGSVTGGGMIQLKTPEAAASVLDHKIKGALVLNSLFKDAAPDFFVLFSSTLSITGVFGQVDYCAANAFLDAFACSTDSLPNTIVINWGTSQWENWQQPLMSGSAEMPAQLKQAQEMYGITVEEGVDAFSRILSNPLPQVVVSTQDFQALLDQQNAFSASSFLEELEKSRRLAPAHSRPDSGAAYVPPGNQVERTITDFWQDLFGIKQVGIHDNFFDLGGNSLLAIQLVSRLRKAFQIELPMSKLFESPTVTELARAVAASQEEQRQFSEMSRLLDDIENLSPEEVQARLG
jgi:acyl transferase domain-containing protein/acyl carrier protein